MNVSLPEWIAESLGGVILGVTGFIGSRFLENQVKARLEAKILSDNVVRLTMAVENASGDIQSVKDEIHNQVGDLKKEFHDQIGGLREELKESRMEYRERLALMDQRLNSVTTHSNENRDAIVSGNVFGLDL